MRRFKVRLAGALEYNPPGCPQANAAAHADIILTLRAWDVAEAAANAKVVFPGCTVLGVEAI